MMPNYLNPLNQGSPSVPSGPSSLEGALELRSELSTETISNSETRSSETRDIVLAEQDTKHNVEQDIQSQLYLLQRSVTLVFWYQVRVAPNAVVPLTSIVSVGLYRSNSASTRNTHISVIPVVTVSLLGI